jgi:AcrR family transcriptional regulator
MVTVSTSKAYHHGDLRSALIEAGLAHLEAGGEADISLRQLAREVGVSATAVYRHFPDKRALLAALAARGFALLGIAQREASQAAGGGVAGFAATGRAYVRFALANPALFRLTFTHAGIGSASGLGDDDAAQLLLSYAREFAGQNAPALALQAWSVAHGLAMLMLDGRVKPSEATIDAVIDAGTLFVRQGEGITSLKSSLSR